MRYLFYAMIILAAVLAIVVIDQIVYWSCRLVAGRHWAHVIHWTFTATLIVVMNLISDILYKVADPRINLE